MPVDNEWYHDPGDAWWDPEGVVGALHEINPVRADYFGGVPRALTGLRAFEHASVGALRAQPDGRRQSRATASRGRRRGGGWESHRRESESVRRAY